MHQSLVQSVTRWTSTLLVKGKKTSYMYKLSENNAAPECSAGDVPFLGVPHKEYASSPNQKLVGFLKWNLKGSSKYHKTMACNKAERNSLSSSSMQHRGKEPDGSKTTTVVPASPTWWQTLGQDFWKTKEEYPDLLSSTRYCIRRKLWQHWTWHHQEHSSMSATPLYSSMFQNGINKHNAEMQRVDPGTKDMG